MKKNMFPIVGIAFVVAIISTAVFYGLFANRLKSGTTSEAQPVLVATHNLERGDVLQSSDVRLQEISTESVKGPVRRPETAIGKTMSDPIAEGQPITESSISRPNVSSGIPKGMRAVSIRVAESSGLAGVLQRGSKVDIQAVSGRDTASELRTILQDIPVLDVLPQKEANPFIVTVLVRAQDSDLIALADSGARLRIALRNSSDEDTLASKPMALTTVFQPGFQPGHESTPPTPAVAPAAVAERAPAHAVQLLVQVLGASDAAWKQIQSKLAANAGGSSVQVASLHNAGEAGELIRSLAGKHELDIVSSSRISGDSNRAAVYSVGTQGCQLRVRIQPQEKLNYRVQPEVVCKRAEGTETRRFEADVHDGGDFVVSGLFTGAGEKDVLEQLFPGRGWSAHNLLLVVTTEPVVTGAESAALEQNKRGH